MKDEFNNWLGSRRIPVLLPSLCGIIFFGAGLIGYTEYQNKNTYDQFLASSASSLAFANRLIGTSLGLSSNSLTPSQSKKAKDLLRLIALNGDIKCLKLQSNSYSLSYPPKQFCNIEDETLMISEKLQRSTGLF